MHKSNEILQKYLKDTKELQHCFEMEMYIATNGEHFTQELAEKAVSCMENGDNTDGEHWNIKEAENLAMQSGIKFEHFNCYDWYYVLNMMYSDYCEWLKDNTNHYVQLAKLWLMDKDVKKGKAYRYYMKVVK